LIIFSAHGIGGQSGQGGCGKYALQYVGEEDFPAASKAILDRADRRQSKFADKITGFRNGCMGKACAGRIKQGKSEGAIKGSWLLMEWGIC
jgi:hypothetical protein